MALINPKILFWVILIIAVLLLFQVTEAPIQEFNRKFSSSLLLGTLDVVRDDICDQIKQVYKSDEPCLWNIDRVYNIVKIVVGSKVIAEVQYGKWHWNQMYSEVQNAIRGIFPSLEGNPLVTAYVKVEPEFEKRGIGSYILSTADRILAPGTIRIVLDTDYWWIKPGVSIPDNATSLLHGIWLFIVGQH